MKELIVICASIILGIFIYHLIMGNQDSSVINSMADLWRAGIGIRSY